MSSWFEVFDSELVKLMSRKRIYQVWMGVAIVAIVLAIGTGLAADRGWSSFLVGNAAAGILLATVLAGWALHRRIGSRVWCLKLSDVRVVGLDYARKNLTLDWTRVDMIGVGSNGLEILGEDQTEIRVTRDFTEFSKLSRRICDYAEFYDIPVLIDGQRWQSLELEGLLDEALSNEA